jgi:hypothetical protein
MVPRKLDEGFANPAKGRDKTGPSAGKTRPTPGEATEVDATLSERTIAWSGEGPVYKLIGFI